MTYNHHVSGHLQMEKHVGDIASRSPSVCSSPGSNVIPELAQQKGSAFEIIQYSLPQLLHGQILSRSHLPSSPRFGKGFWVSSHQRIEEWIVFSEYDHSWGLVYEELVVFKEQII